MIPAGSGDGGEKTEVSMVWTSEATCRVVSCVLEHDAAETALKRSAPIDESRIPRTLLQIAKTAS